MALRRGSPGFAFMPTRILVMNLPLGKRDKWEASDESL